MNTINVRMVRVRHKVEPLVWLTCGALGVASLMIIGLLCFIIYSGITVFWPSSIIHSLLKDGTAYLGEVVRYEYVKVNNMDVKRQLLYTGNYDLYGDDYKWISEDSISKQSAPLDAVLVERLEWGRFLGFIDSLKIKDRIVTGNFDVLWREFDHYHSEVRERFLELKDMEQKKIGDINFKMESLRLKLKKAELKYGKDSQAYLTLGEKVLVENNILEANHKEVEKEINIISNDIAMYKAVFKDINGKVIEIDISNIVRIFPPNRLNIIEKIIIYMSRFK